MQWLRHRNAQTHTPVHADTGGGGGGGGDVAVGWLACVACVLLTLFTAAFNFDLAD
jgi:hypothetical protein